MLLLLKVYIKQLSDDPNQPAQNRYIELVTSLSMNLNVVFKAGHHNNV